MCVCFAESAKSRKHDSVATVGDADMKVTSLRYLDAKFHHPSLGASPLIKAKPYLPASRTLVIIKTAKRK